MAHEILELKSVHPARGYSHAAKAGKTVYIAGQVARDTAGNIVGRGDFRAQARQVFTNLKNILLETGGTLRHVVKMTTFLTRLEHRDAFQEIRREFLAEPFPPHTFLVVQSLAVPEYLIEVEAVAVLD